MPETSLVQPLIAQARKSELEMIERSPKRHGMEDVLKAERSFQPPSNLRSAWETLFKEARCCTRCDLHLHATQTVFGEGPLDAKLMLVGEQPGDVEDLDGRPFVGPAGRLLDGMLEEAGVDRSQTYVTNAVKHFKFEPRGKRRIHSKPDAGEIEACNFWLQHELDLVRSPVTVALGATAARALLGKAVTIGKLRGSPIRLVNCSECWVTVHPSSLLRMPEPERRNEERARFIEEMKQIWARADELAK